MIQGFQMGEVAKQFFQDQNMKNMDSNNAQIGTWMIMGGGGGCGGGGDSGDDSTLDSESMESSSSYEDSSANSAASSSSSLESDLIEDASSSSSTTYSSPSSSLSHSNGPLYELSELMLQLPIKRGLSKYYQGKSQSYTSLESVKSIEDLAKKGGVSSYSKRMKSCKSYAAGLDIGHNKFYTPKATISKKTPRGSLLSLLGNRGTLVTSCCSKPPISSVQKNF